MSTLLKYFSMQTSNIKNYRFLSGEKTGYGKSALLSYFYPVCSIDCISDLIIRVQDTVKMCYKTLQLEILEFKRVPNPTNAGSVLTQRLKMDSTLPSVTKFIMDEDRGCTVGIKMFDSALRANDKFYFSSKQKYRSQNYVCIGQINADIIPQDNKDKMLCKSFVDVGAIGLKLLKNSCDSTLFLFIFGLFEIFFGAFLSVFCFRSGGLLGKCLMSDGIYDAITAAKYYKKHRQIAWKSLQIQKVVSFAVILVYVGLDAVEDALKTVTAAMKDNEESTLFLLEGCKIVSNVIIFEAAKGICVECLIKILKYYWEKSNFMGIKANIKPAIYFYVRATINDNAFLKHLLKYEFKGKENILFNLILNKIKKLNNFNYENALKLNVASVLLRRFVVDNTVSTSYVLVALFVFFELNQQIFGVASKINEAIKDIYNEKGSWPLTNLDKTDKTMLFKSRILNFVNKNHESFNEDLSNQLSDLTSANITLILLNCIIHPFLRRYLNIAFEEIALFTDLSLACDTQYYTAKKRILICQSGDLNRIDKPYIDKSISNIAIRKASKIIEDTVNGAEAGLPHLGALSICINRPIQVLDWNGNLNYIIGGATGLNPVKIQYHQFSRSNGLGHWTLPNSMEPFHEHTGSNSCLFNVIAYQTGRDAYDLRSSCASVMNDTIDLLARQIADIELVKGYDINTLMMGGAKYAGRNSDDARRVIDASQGVSGHNHHPRGHPRGHASSSSSDPEGSVENYSRRSSSLSDAKSGFQDRNSQDEVGHAALSSTEAQTAMRQLNGGSSREAITIPTSELRGLNDVLMAKWYDGQRQTDWTNMRSVTLVLQHHQGEQNNPDADVHVHTLYPRD